MEISRRDFLKWSSASAAAMGLSSGALTKLEAAVASGGKPQVLWLQGAGCSGCTISLLNSVRDATIDDILINTIDLKYHHNLMTASGSFATSIYDEVSNGQTDNFILVIEGGIPTGINGEYCVIGEKNGVHWTMEQAAVELAAKAQYVIAVGTCASYGGAPHGNPNPTNITPITDPSLGGSSVESKLINLPGCPVHPYTFTRTLIELLTTGIPRLTKDNAPEFAYKKSIHDECFRKGNGETELLGHPTKCLKGAGCKGPQSKNDCPTRKWNNEQNWCLESGHHCISCATSDFPKTPLYKIDS